MNLKELKKKLDARTLRERLMLLSAVVVVIVYSWFLLVYEAMNAGQVEISRQIQGAMAQINNELTRNQNIRNSYTRDPNAFIRTRITALQQEVESIDAELLALYGELILPQQMAGVLTQILQSETTLKLISFENLPPESLFASENAGASEASNGGISVYRHGLRLEFEGDYLETIRFLQRVESLTTSFFWDNLAFHVEKHPNARITLNIFTLSTERGFIGV